MAMNNRRVALIDENGNEILQQEETYYDDWMREDYILVSNTTSAKDLKPYQRMVVLRRPTGEQKCIIDKSLSFREIKKLQDIIAKHGFIDINSPSIKRIIPNDYKTSSEKVDLNVEETEIIAKSIRNLDSLDYAEHIVNHDNELKSIIKLQDDEVKYSLTNSSKPSSATVEDVDIIDDVRIFIPHEERKVKWHTLDEHYNPAIIDEYERNINSKNVISEEEQAEIILDSFVDPNYQENLELNNEMPIDESNLQEEYNQVEVQEQEELLVNNNFEVDQNVLEEYYGQHVNVENDNEVYEEDVANLEQEQIDVSSEENYTYENYVEENNDANDIPLAETQMILPSEEYETDYQDYNDAVESNDEQYEIEKPTETVTSFFKNEVSYKNHYEPQQPRRRYKFYNDTSSGKTKKIVLNKKLKMYVNRKKINKELIEANERKLFR